MERTSPRWRQGEFEVTRSICWSPPGCHGGCGVLLYSKSGKLQHIAGDESNSYNRGYLCVRGLSIREMVYHPQRLRYPLLRAGRRGQNRWRQLPLGEAIELVARKFLEIKKRYGAESIIFCKGTARDIGAYLSRLCFGFGSPNYFGLGPGNGNACYRPRVATSTVMLGGLPVPDLGQFDTAAKNEPRHIPPQCLLIWGANPIYSHPDGLFGGWVADLLKRGSVAIVVDPQRTWLATKAKHWLQIKPGTDAALVLGMLNILFRNDLIDHNFCAHWVSGVAAVKAAAGAFPPERVASMTGLKCEDIIQATRCFARNQPAALGWGVGVDMNHGCLGTIQGLISLMALSGNIENPGGMVLPGDPLGVKRRGDDTGDFPEIRTKRIGAQEYPLIEIGNPYAQPDVLLEQMETGKPYPLRAAWIQGTSIIPASFADPQRVLRLFKKLDFNVVVDVFLNPAAVALADLVLPAAMYPEKDGIYVHCAQLGAINRAVDPPGECRSDAEIVLKLGRRIAPRYFPWNSVRQWLDERLAPSGFTFSELAAIGSVVPPLEYNRQAKGKLRGDGAPGFQTPSGKIELDSAIFKELGLKSTPHYRDFTVEYRSRYGVQEYPFILSSGARKPYYFCAEQRNVPSLRKLQPLPFVNIHPRAAQERGISAGDWVKVSSPFGSIRMQAQISDRFAPDVIHCDFGWWFPEEEAAEPSLYGVMRSNVNALLPSGLQGPSGFGYPFRCFVCNVEKASVAEVA